MVFETGYLEELYFSTANLHVCYAKSIQEAFSFYLVDLVYTEVIFSPWLLASYHP